MVWSRSPMDASFFQRSTIGGASISTPTKIDRVQLPPRLIEQGSHKSGSAESSFDRREHCQSTAIFC
jgi:hypothetical protein